MIRPAARHTDPDTSHEAATSIHSMSAVQERIVEVLTRYQPATDEDIEAFYGHLAILFDWPPVSPSGLRSRRAELVFHGIVQASAESGRTRTGRRCSMWELHP